MGAEGVKLTPYHTSGRVPSREYFPCAFLSSAYLQADLRVATLARDFVTRICRHIYENLMRMFISVP